MRLHDSRAVIVKTGICSGTTTTTTAAAAPGSTGDNDKAAGKTLSLSQQAKELENWEKAKRPVEFEVEEFLRR